MASTRTETDTFGPIEVAGDRYWGAQAQRSLGNFKIGWEKQPLPVIRALGIVKQAVARANMSLGVLDKDLGKVIVEASQEVIDAAGGPWASNTWGFFGLMAAIFVPVGILVMCGLALLLDRRSRRGR